MAPRKKKAEIVEMTDVVKEEIAKEESVQTNNVEITDKSINAIPVKKPYVRPLRKL